jgi:hypothetical protein
MALIVKRTVTGVAMAKGHQIWGNSASAYSENALCKKSQPFF